MICVRPQKTFPSIDVLRTYDTNRSETARAHVLCKINITPSAIISRMRSDHILLVRASVFFRGRRNSSFDSLLFLRFPSRECRVLAVCPSTCKTSSKAARNLRRLKQHIGASCSPVQRLPDVKIGTREVFRDKCMLRRRSLRKYASGRTKDRR
jgi:hypothetical protein